MQVKNRTVVAGATHLAVMLIGLMAVFLAPLSSTSLYAQADGKKTIDITSSFKPKLMEQPKINFTASSYSQQTDRPKLSYQIPKRNLAFSYAPASIQPLAYSGTDSLEKENLFYLKAGFGTFKTPVFKGIASLGNNEKFNGNLEANAIGSQGKFSYQQYRQMGAGINGIAHLNQQNELQLYGGVGLFSTRRYGGLARDTANQNLWAKLAFTDLYAGTTLNNVAENAAGVQYKVDLQLQSLIDKQQGKDFSALLNAPFSKQISDDFSASLGIKAIFNRFSGPTSKYNNGVVSFPASLQFKPAENITIKAGLVPYLQQGNFGVLPDMLVEYYLNENNFLLQAGATGYFEERSYRSIIRQNPWAIHADSLLHTRNTLFFGALKSTLNSNFSFRLEAGYSDLRNLPLLVATGAYLDSFKVVNATKANRLSISGEAVYTLAKQLTWNTRLAVNQISGLPNNNKAFGILPMELRTSLLLKPIEKLQLQADLYFFNGAWQVISKSGSLARGKSGSDLNVGVEYQIQKGWSVWVQGNNLFNQNYQRWSGYSVLGAQVSGGVIVRL